MKYLETLKNIKLDNKRKRENLLLLLVLLVILLISINYIFNDNNKNQNEVPDKIDEQINNEKELDCKIAEVLNQISGVRDASVLINYSNNGKNNIAYNSKETLNENGKVLNVEKNVAYNETSGNKTAIIQVHDTPTVEGVIIVAEGVENADIKQKISTAIGNLLGVASYKVQVFEK